MGYYDHDPLDSFFTYLYYNLSMKKKVKSFIEYFRDELGIEIDVNDEFLKTDVREYFQTVRNQWNKEFNTKDARSGFAYFIANKYFDLQTSMGLQYFKYKNDTNINFSFFDPNFKIFIGSLYLSRNRNLPGKSYDVSISAADRELVGGGYGTKMYLIVMNNVDYLVSSTTLFMGSYRLWRHILPKYANIWGVMEYEGIEIKQKIEPGQEVKQYDYFIGSTKYKTLK